MTTSVIRDDVTIVEHPVLKRRTLLVLPVVPEDAPYAVREGIARRRVAAVSGECPCGAVVDFGELLPGEVGIGEVFHERWCPADTDRLVKACRRWTR